MSTVSRSFTLATIAAFAVSSAIAQVTGTYPATPLASKQYAYPTGIPYRVDTDTQLIRGTQVGYNICNSTTENQQSLCQTSIVNALDDFCVWAPSTPGHTVGEVEGEMIAWCSKPGHGTRLIPKDALTGLQFLKTPDFIQIVGFLDQTKINMVQGDYGGEMDPHGADLRGNPLGGIMYSNAFNGSYVQVNEWTNFIGSNLFCLKACNPYGKNPAQYCQHIYDRIGCAFNAPNRAMNNVFESCDAESGDFPGVYTSPADVNSGEGAAAPMHTYTYSQPAESLGPITTMPYTARVPASSNCKTFSSAALFANLPFTSVSAVPTPTGGGVGSLWTPSSASAGAGASGPTTMPLGSAASRAAAAAAVAAAGIPATTSSTKSDASTLALSGISFMGVVFSVLFLA